jgi:cobalt/nickel transport system permease protein
MILWAVHIADGVLTMPWVAGGFVGAALLAVFAAWRLREEELPRIALLTAAFFVASSIHVQLGPSSAHLLLNGLLGIVLGRRAPLAILVGVTLQALLLQHGGPSTIGVNTCDMAIPALLAWGLYTLVRRLPWARHGWFRTALVAGSAVVWFATLVYAFELLASNMPESIAGFSSFLHAYNGTIDPTQANAVILYPATLLIIAILAAVTAWAERRLENQPEFALGLLIGEFAVLATLACYCTVLVLGGADDWRVLAVATLLVHLPIVAVEGTVLGFTVGYLARVKPELLGEAAKENEPCAVGAAD